MSVEQLDARMLFAKSSTSCLAATMTASSCALCWRSISMSCRRVDMEVRMVS